MVTKRPAFILLAAMLFICAASTIFAGDIYTFKLEQARDQLPSIRVYAELLDKEGAAIQNPSKINLTGSIGSMELKIEEIKQFDKTDEGIAYIFLVDISKSLKPRQFQEMREAIIEFTDSMKGKDRAAIITFGKDVTVQSDFTSDKATLKDKISAMSPTDGQTQLHLGIIKALELGRRGDPDIPVRKIIITLSDGEDDFAGGSTKDEVLEALKTDKTPIYSIGFHNPPLTPRKETGLKTLGEFARRSGGQFFESKTIKDMYAKIHKALRQTYVIRANCAECVADGKNYRLEINLAEGSTRLTDGLNIRLYLKAASPANPKAAVMASLAAFKRYIVVAVIIMIPIVMALFILRRKKKIGAQHRKADSTPGDNNMSPAMGNKPGVKKAGALAGIGLKLITVSGVNNNSVYNLNLANRKIIGRNKSKCDLAIPDEEISSVHCELIRDHNAIYIRDLGTTNGTLVNGTQINERCRLSSGDLIVLGQTELRVQF